VTGPLPCTPQPAATAKVDKSTLSFALSRVLPTLLILIAFALRTYHIAEQSIWRDEGVSLYLAASSMPVILADRASTVHPPLYFVLLNVWTKLAGASELSARFFSLVFGVLLIPCLYSVVGKIFDQKTALVTMAIAAFSPLYVVYSQEVRVYSIMPLLYLILIYKLGQLQRPEGQTRWNWITFTVVELLCLYLHYFSILVIASANLLLAVTWLRRRGIILRRWILSQAAVGLACTPWILLVLATWRRQGAPQDYFADPLQKKGILEMTSLVWHFLNGGKDLRAHSPFVFLSWLLAASLVGALVVAFREPDRRKQLLAMLCHWLVPLSMAIAVWWLRPMTHPRYVMMFSTPLFIVVGRAVVVAMSAGRPGKLAGALLATVLTATFILGLGVAYFDTQYFKDNVRGLVRHLEPLTSANDVIVVHPIDYAVAYYYDGPAPIAMVDPDDEQGMSALLATLPAKRNAFVAWPFGTPVGKVHRLPFEMERHGILVDRHLFKGYSLATYEIEGPVPSVDVQLASVDFGAVQLTGAFYQAEVRADGGICLALRWRLVQPTAQGYKATIILWDEQGRRLSASDMLLRNEWGLNTASWSPGDEVVNYYVVPVPLGTPPLSYPITVGVYDAASMERLSFLDHAGNPAGVDSRVGEVSLTRAHDFARDPYGTRTSLAWETVDQPEIADGLALEGFAIHDHPAQQMVNVTLRWKAVRDDLPRYVPHLRFGGDDNLSSAVGSALFEHRYPTSEWVQGEVLVEQRNLAYPRSGDRAVLEIEVDGKTVPLADLALDRSERSFATPPMQHVVDVRFGDFAQLLGYDLKTMEVSTGETVALTLYWQAINEKPLSTSYTVFTHLLSEDGRLVGQHDGKPAGGTRPTMTWVRGEVVADTHEMSFTDPGYEGTAFIEVGLYESHTIERVFTEDGNDHIILSTEIVVKGAE
jgi:mannosyltransferase